MQNATNELLKIGTNVENKIPKIAEVSDKIQSIEKLLLEAAPRDRSRDRRGPIIKDHRTPTKHSSPGSRLNSRASRRTPPGPSRERSPVYRSNRSRSSSKNSTDSETSVKSTLPKPVPPPVKTHEPIKPISEIDLTDEHDYLTDTVDSAELLIISDNEIDGEPIDAPEEIKPAFVKLNRIQIKPENKDIIGDDRVLDTPMQIENNDESNDAVINEINAPIRVQIANIGQRRKSDDNFDENSNKKR